ncbi:hypothetical protein D3C71_1514400 [compost metagenome]
MHARALCALAQKLCKQAAVACARIGQVDRACQGRFGRQAGFDHARRIGIDFVQRYACVAHHLQGRLQCGLFLLVAQQNQPSAAGFEIKLMARSDGVDAGQAVLRQAFKDGRWGALVARHMAPAPEPCQVGPVQAPGHPECGVWAHDAQCLAETGNCPRVQHQGSEQAGGCKAGFFSGGAALFENGDLMAIAGQLIGSGDADNAGAHDGNLHGLVCFWPVALDYQALAAIVFVVFVRFAG